MGHTRLSMMATAEEAERKQVEDMAQLQAEVLEQEAYIKKLRAEIAALERGETTGFVPKKPHASLLARDANAAAITSAVSETAAAKASAAKEDDGDGLSVGSDDS